MKRFLVALILLAGLAAAMAQGRDDQYVTIYTLIQEADALSRNLQVAPALDKYREAQAALDRFRRGNPDWNPSVVKYRLDYLATRIRELSPASGTLPERPDPGRTQPATPPGPTPEQVAQLNQQMGALQDQVRALQAEKGILEAKLKEALSVQPRAESRDLAKAGEQVRALQKENELLKASLDVLRKQPAGAANADSATASAQAGALAQARTQIAALQSDRDLLRVEKSALEQKVKQLSQTPAQAAPPSAAPPEDPRRIRQLEREVASLKARLEEAKQDLARRKAKATPGKLTELQNEITALRTRLDVLEARKVPYTPEEMALFKKPEVKIAETSTVKKSARQFPPGSAALVAEAQRHFTARRLDKAEETYQQILRQDEKNSRTLANLASIQLERGRLTEAEKNARQAVAAEPEDAFAQLVLGQIKLSQKDYDGALESLSAAARLDPENAEIQNYLGLVLSEKGLRGPAESALRKAVQLRPGYGDAHNNLAVVYLTQQPPMVELAKWHYKKALSAGNPPNAALEQMIKSKEKSGSAQ